MSYYCYITGIYKSYRPQLNRTLRSSSVPRHVPPMDPDCFARSSSVPPSSYYSHPEFSHAASPFRDRAMSVPREVSYHYSAFVSDRKVSDYMVSLEREDTAKRYVSSARASSHHYPAGSFSSQYNYYDSNKHSGDYLYPITRDVLGSWKHYNLSAETLNFRNTRGRSPIITRELDRYVGSTKVLILGYYNYRRVPYFGGSDEYSNLRSNAVAGRRRF
eukprot:TRINITY_DN4176_c0_g1_i4.p1 TRINITY_DN4176_c0_g1~~TRINITY_DN4176_c0_g1_i4.p1  ORF type:complete len:217 (+),score=61.93 TRINITY_DN4176_c0_g1_i4:60-710(+)